MGFFKRLKALRDYDNAISVRESRIKNLDIEIEMQIKAADRNIRAIQEQAEANLSRVRAELAQLENESEKQRELERSRRQSAEEEQTKLEAKTARVESQLRTQQNKVDKLKLSYNSMLYALKSFTPKQGLEREMDGLSPTVHLKLHNEDIRSLRKMMRENNKEIDAVLEKYRGRYTTKANATIYSLMVIALRAELQNILYSLRFEKLDKAIEDIKTITSKYFAIAQEGNQNIVGTLTNFIGEIEYLFIRAAEIEYEYYIQQQRIKEEQRALREQMRIEKEEQQALEKEQKRLDSEASKYTSEIESVQAKLESASEDETRLLNARIAELEGMLNDLEQKRGDIVRLQHGKAGYVYIISNLGSFGDHVFKIGMTRRLSPQERIDELGDASVPFRFDVHSFIFSEDAVTLESKLHTALHTRRVNKVNLRKEFFDVTIDELEELVHREDPSAEFNRTMLAEQYRQSLSMVGEDLGNMPTDFDDDEDE